MTTQLVRYEQARTALAAESMSVSEWVWHARSSFRPSDRQTCEVCGKYKSLTQAHHVIPLSAQAAKGRMSINHKHVWLCPTHHAAVHVLIEQAGSGRDLAGKACLNVLAELDVEEIRPLLALVNKAFE